MHTSCHSLGIGFQLDSEGLLTDALFGGITTRARPPDYILLCSTVMKSIIKETKSTLEVSDPSVKVVTKEKNILPIPQHRVQHSIISPSTSAAAHPPSSLPTNYRHTHQHSADRR